jgi:Xaa-Pro aminopeptidase
MAPPPPPPPPPPPLCFPSFSRKPKQSKSQDLVRTHSEKSRSSSQRSRSGSYSPTATLHSDPEKLAFDSDSEIYDVPALPNESKAKLIRGNTIKSKSGTLVRADTKQSIASKLGYGWGAGKVKESEKELVKQESMEPLPRPPLHHSNTRSSNKSNQSKQSFQSSRSNQTKGSNQTNGSGGSKASGSKASGSRKSPIRPPFWPNDSQSTLVGSALERKIADVESIKERVDTSDRLDEMRKLMAKDNLDY